MKRTVPIQHAYCSGLDYGQILSIDTEVIDAPTSPLIHPLSRFWLINDGHGILKLQDREYTLEPGTIVSVLPWQISDIVRVDAPLQYYLLAYYFDHMNRIIKSAYNTESRPLNLIEDMAAHPVVHCGPEEYREIRAVFRRLQWETGTDSVSMTEPSDPFHMIYLENKLIELILLFLKAGRENPPDLSPSGYEIQKSDILHYMYNHLSQKLTLAGLSRLFYMSESSIRSYITQTTGLSFFDLLNEMRVSKALPFLLYTDLTLKELAEILGFVDSSHLSKVFSARIGMKAGDFRNAYRKIPEDGRVPAAADAYGIAAYLYRNYEEDLTPKDVADRFHITVKELNAVLLYLAEKNFGDFLNFIRVNRASELLKNTDKSITQIALDVGYHSAKTLTRNFLKFRAMTPGAFRREIGLQDPKL